MIKSDVAVRLSGEFGDAASDADLLALFNTWIDEAYINICGKFRWQHKIGLFTISTVAGQKTYNLDTNIRRVIVIKNLTNNQEIIFRTYKDLVQDGIDLAQQSQIYWWYYRGFDGFQSTESRHYVIDFAYIPDAAYSLEIQAEKSTVETIAVTEHIPIPSELLPSLYAYVRKLANLHESQYEDADRWNNEYMTGVAEYKLYLEKNPADPVRSPQESDLYYGRATYLPFLQYPTNIVGG